MKINEIVNEATVAGKLGTALGKTVGGVAKGVGAVAGGVAGIPGAVKQGYQAGKAAVGGQPATDTAQGGVVQQAPGYQSGPIQPRTGAQQYTQDIAAAIRAGAAGDISAKTATATSYQRAPVGTKINPWTKTNDGWVNSTNNKAATSFEAETLDRKWYSETQKQARQQAQTAKTQPSQTATSTPPSWDPKKKILTKDGLQYKKTTKGWQDIATDELVDPKYSAELQTAFDQASGRASVQPAATAQQPVQTTAQQSVGTQQPDVSQLTAEERAEMIRQIKQKLGQA